MLVKGFTVWFTGLPASGKTTVATMLHTKLMQYGLRSHLLDGNAVRNGLSKDLLFSDEDRRENIRRVAHVAKMLNDDFVIAVVALVSPLTADRKMAEEIIGENKFREVFMDTPLDVCEERDPKGLYKAARAGTLANFTGVDGTYEEPVNSATRIITVVVSPEQAVVNIWNALHDWLMVETTL